MPEVLYIKTSNSSFILTDEKILAKNFALKSFLVGNHRGLKYLWRLISLTGFMLIYGPFAKVYFLRFADYYAFIPAVFARLFRKKLIVVLGGYDATHLPQFQYGVYHKPFRAFCARFAIKTATWILPNNPTLIDNYNEYVPGQERKEGIKNLVPGFEGKVKVIYNGFDSESWKAPAKTIERKKQVVTAAFLGDTKTVFLKGMDDFAYLATQFPEIPFIVIGGSAEIFSAAGISIPRNLQIIESLKQDELKEYYYSSKVFCLFSLTEGMPNVLCEAMLCGCIPVGSAVNFIPEIVSNFPFFR